MRIIYYFLWVVFITCFFSLSAQDVTTVEAASSEISENLDLEAVASAFGESKDLEDFEKRLNDPKTQISNLDLNEDGEVDYLRVIEASEGDAHLVTIQSVIEKDKYQDVAVVDVTKDDSGETQVQVVGDVYMYGPDYIITPVYVQQPVVVVWFWGPYYSPWRSPYYWGYYPPYYSPWRPYPTPRYRTNVRVNVNVNNSYKRTTVRNSRTTVDLQNKSRKNDFGSKNPDKSYANRGKSSVNKSNANAKIKEQNSTNGKDIKASTGKKVDENWKTEAEKSGAKSKVSNNKTTVSDKKSGAKSKVNDNKAAVSGKKSSIKTNNVQSKSTNAIQSKSANKANTRAGSGAGRKAAKKGGGEKIAPANLRFNAIHNKLMFFNVCYTL